MVAGFLLGEGSIPVNVGMVTLAGIVVCKHLVSANNSLVIGRMTTEEHRPFGFVKALMEGSLAISKYNFTHSSRELENSCRTVTCNGVLLGWPQVEHGGGDVLPFGGFSTVPSRQPQTAQGPDIVRVRG